MAKYDVTYACGHEETLQLYGPTKDRYRKIEQLEKYGECSACKQARRDRENAAAAEANQDAGLPALTGSPKQVSWAESIRAEAIKSMDATRAKLERNIERIRAAIEAGQIADDKLEQARKAVDQADQIKAAYDHVRNQTAASWWIDNRNLPGSLLLTEELGRRLKN